MKATLSLLVVALLTCISCKDSGTDPPPDNGFAVYKLIDTSLTAPDAWGVPLESLRLAPSPFFTAKDLSAYFWSRHAFVPAPALDSILKQMARLPGKSRGMPFVVMVGRERIYLGAFWWAYSSFMPRVPYIMLPRTSYNIEAIPLSSEPDPRQDPRIQESLRAAGILME